MIYAACPLCNKNDRVTKATVALSDEINRIKNHRPQWRRFSHTGFSRQKFVPNKFEPRDSGIPLAPDPVKISFTGSQNGFLDGLDGCIHFLIISFTVSFFFTLFIYAIFESVLGLWICLSCNCIVILSPVFELFARRVQRKKWEDNFSLKLRAFNQEEAKRKQAFEKDELERRQALDKEESERERVYYQEVEKMKQEFEQSENERMKIETERYKRAIERSDMVYYCERDDIVFIIGTTEYEKPDKFQEFLYR